MSISGTFLILFLLFHSIMNFVVILSPDTYNVICEFLGANWYALVGTLVLAGGFVIHILFATYLTFLNLRARGREKYAVVDTQKDVSWASKNMFVLGLVICGFLLLHFYQFWSKMQFVELTGIGDHHLAADGTYWVNHWFSQPVYAILYIVWLGALWFHLTHGVWSLMQTFGFSNNKWLPRIKVIGNIVATIVVLIFMCVPVWYLFGCGA
jgi:succinate dehydrogenase / fumarate reductase cytochrome b subunit